MERPDHDLNLTRRDAAALALPLLALASVFLPLARPGCTLWASDLLRIFSVLQFLEQDTLARWGEIPFLNPLLACGNPNLANLQAQHFYPPALLYRAIDPTRALAFQFPLHLALMAVGAYVLARVVRVSRTGASVSALVLALNGRIGAEVFAGHLAMMSSVAWIPWQLASLDLLVRRRAWAGAPMLASFLAFSFLAGHPQILIYEGFVLAVWGLSLGVVLRARGPGVGAALAFAVFAAAGAAALAAVQLLPFLRFQPFFFRSVAPGALDRGWFAARNLWHVLVPGAGVIVRPGASDPENGFFWEGIVTLGAAPLVLALAAIAAGGRRRIVALCWAAQAAAICYGLGRPTWMVEAVERTLPLLTRMRMPVRAWIAVLPLGALLAGIGLDQILLLGRKEGEGERRRTGLLVGVALAALVVARLLAVETQIRPLPAWSLLAPAAVVGLLAFTLDRKRIDPATAAPLIALAVAVELVVAFRPMVHAVPIDVATGTTPTVYALGRLPGPFRVLDRAGLASQERGARRGIEYLDAQTEPTLTAAYLELLTYAWVAMPAPDAETLERADFARVAHPRLLSLMGLAYVVGGPQDAAPWLSPVFALVLRSPNNPGWTRRIEILKNRDVLPRAFAVGKCVVEPDRARRLAALAAADPRAEAVTESPVSLPEKATEPVAGLFDRLSPNRFLVGIRLSRPGLLVVAEQYDPAWRAFAGGRELPVVRADHAFLGVVLEPGAQVVHFEARPRELAAGRAITTVSAFAVLAFLVAGWRAERRRTAAGSRRRLN